MTVVLRVSNTARLAAYTGDLRGRPRGDLHHPRGARLGDEHEPGAESRLRRGRRRLWAALWIYFVAPPIGMLLAAEVYVRRHGLARVLCAKLHHDNPEPLHLPLPLRRHAGGAAAIDVHRGGRDASGLTRSDAMTTDYDVIIIGTGAGGGTLLHALAPTGKRILVLERGDFVPREKDNWRYQGGQPRRPLQHQGDLARQGRQAAPPAHELLRRRQHQVLRRRALPPAPRGLRRDQAPRRRLAGLAHRLRRARALLHAGRAALPRARRARRGSDGAAGAALRTRTRRSATSRGSSSSPTTSRGSGLQPFHVPLGIMLDEQSARKSPCIRCATCDGIPCLVNAKSDAHVVCVEPALAHTRTSRS